MSSDGRLIGNDTRRDEVTRGIEGIQGAQACSVIHRYELGRNQEERTDTSGHTVTHDMAANTPSESVEAIRRLR